MEVDCVEYKTTRDFTPLDLEILYVANNWSSGKRPDQLYKSLQGCDVVVSAWIGTKLIGLGSAISDGCLVVYYPHILVLPDYQRRGIGAEIVRRLTAHFKSFHQHTLVADRTTSVFYEKCGFARAEKMEAMWIYSGDDH